MATAPAGSMTGQHVFSVLNPQRDSSGSMWAINPATGQPERLIRGIHGSSTYGDTGNDPYEGTHYFFESDPNASADAAARGVQLGMSDADKKHFNTGSGLVQGGLATMGAFAGAGALGYGPASAGGSAAAGGTAAAGAPVSAAAGGEAAGVLGAAESFVGPATGAIEAAGTQASGALTGAAAGAGAPAISGIAAGAGPFVPPALGGAAMSSVLAPGNGVPGSNGVLADLARGIPGVIGAFAADRQADRYGDLAKQYMDLGAPSRERFEGSFAPGFSMASDPGYSDALDQSAKATLHRLSPSGNPVGSPNAWSTTLSDLYKNTAYPALQGYRTTNASAGGLSTFAPAAVGASNAQVGAQGDVLNSLGAAAGDIFNPPTTTLAQLFREAMRAGR